MHNNSLLYGYSLELITKLWSGDISINDFAKGKIYTRKNTDYDLTLVRRRFAKRNSRLARSASRR